jgi:heptosyltransferase-2
LTGIFDDLMKVNSQNYIEEIYAICGFQWNKEKYILPGYILPDVKIPGNKKIIGINTGVGKKWVTRKFSEDRLITLIRKLEKKYKVVLLGGIEEDAVNKKISSATSAVYYGVFPLKSFIGLVSMCDLIITPVTLALHIAIGLEKKIILLNNIFPPNEFYLYGLGEILEPKINCKYCYKNDFDNKCPSYNCMDKIADQDILDLIKRLLS